MLTPNQITQIKSALADTERYIALEVPRDAGLRPPEVQQRLDAYCAHAAKRQDYIDNPAKWTLVNGKLIAS